MTDEPLYRAHWIATGEFAGTFESSAVTYAEANKILASLATDPKILKCWIEPA